MQISSDLVVEIYSLYLFLQMLIFRWIFHAVFSSIDEQSVYPLVIMVIFPFLSYTLLWMNLKYVIEVSLLLSYLLFKYVYKMNTCFCCFRAFFVFMLFCAILKYCLFLPASIISVEVGLSFPFEPDNITRVCV